MDSANDYLDLVRDALYSRQMKHVGCFAFNQASDRVQQTGTAILGSLERVLREEVMTSCPMDAKSQLKQFPGFANLLVDYFRIASQGQMDRAAEFLLTLRGPVLIEAIRAIRIVWSQTIPAAVVSAIEAVVRTGSPEERAIASWSLDGHRNNQQSEQERAPARKETGV